MEKKNRELLFFIPEYPRIPHVKCDYRGEGVSNVLDRTDLIEDFNIEKEVYVSEKVDGANLGFTWSKNGPLLRNRDHILKKNFIAKTKAKKQFVPAWNYIHEKEDVVKEIIENYTLPLSFYGEWMWAEHSLNYDTLKDYFLLFDVFSPEENQWLSPKAIIDLVGEKLEVIPSKKIKFLDKTEIVKEAERESLYRSNNGKREGIVIKEIDEKDNFIIKRFKVVNQTFKREIDWIKKDLIKNKIWKQ